RRNGERHAAAIGLEHSTHCCARDRGVCSDACQFRHLRAVFRCSARLGLRSSAHRERQVRTGDDAVSEREALGDPDWLVRGDAAALLALLEGAGEQAGIVGGPVRNALLRLPVHEIDIATTAVPEVVVRRVESSGWKTVPTGIEHGTVTVLTAGKTF